MAREPHTHIVESAYLDTKKARRHLSRQEFGRRIYSLLLSKGWTQAELARKTGITPDGISNYIRGNILPTPVSLDKLAKAFGVPPEDILPNYIEGAIDTEVEPTFEMKSSSAEPNKTWIRVNRLVSFTTALKIAELLKLDEAENANPSN